MCCLFARVSHTARSRWWREGLLVEVLAEELNLLLSLLVLRRT